MNCNKCSGTYTARLYPENPGTRARMTEGQIGLELETQRIDRDGHLAQTPHPFEKEPYIDRDFGEAQIEINTPPAPGIVEAQALLHAQLQTAHRKLQKSGELLWPFSCPPAITSEEEIRIADYKGELRKKTDYRQYLAGKYGKRIMTLCGIHFNYSFSEELLRTGFLRSGKNDFSEYRDTLYLQLAEKVLAHSWVVAALLSASPLVDASYYPGGKEGETVLTGYASVRCGEKGYWNPFDPVLSYEDLVSYTESVAQYRKQGLLRHEGELYYPVRIKPAGKYSLRNLRERGVNHIELRMIDLNPFAQDGIDPDDLRFLQMFLIWLASGERMPLGVDGQKRAIKNQKAAARYDLDRVILDEGTETERPLASALASVLEEMNTFFLEAGPEFQKALRHQTDKVRDPGKRYAHRVAELYGNAYLAEGLKRAEQLQEEFVKGSRLDV